jgi:hypothetical protein
MQLLIMSFLHESTNNLGLNPWKKGTVFAFNPNNPNQIAIATSKDPVSVFNIPENGLKGDTSPSLSSYNTNEEVQSIAYNPVSANVFAVALRNGHILVFDDQLASPLFDLEQTRPMITLTWSLDGTMIFALHIDLTLRI